MNVEQLTERYAALVVEHHRQSEQLRELREALEQYADPRHWAISRNGFRNPSCIWIGPGAEDAVPNAVGIARAALSQSKGTSDG